MMMTKGGGCGVVLLCLFWVGTVMAVEFEPGSPHAAVREATDSLLSRFAAVRSMYDSDRVGFYGEIDDVLSPYVNFDGFSRRVMAKYYRVASDEQRARFRDTFKQDLIRTYANALIELDNEEIVVLPPRGRDDGRPEVEVVLMEVRSREGVIYPVKYTMELQDDGRWLLRNVAIDGINLGLQFRSQFAAAYKRHRGDLDQLIADWSSAADGGDG